MTPADPFLVLVEVGEPYGETDAIARAHHALGSERVERFLASLTSEVAPSAQVTGDHIHAARHDRAALALWLRERGLDPELAGVAIRSLRLVPAPGTGTRIGGCGLLPPGSEWPRTTEGRPLSFLAGLDLAELPTDGVLPDHGWLLFFADLDDEGEALGFHRRAHPQRARRRRAGPGRCAGRRRRAARRSRARAARAHPRMSRRPASAAHAARRLRRRRAPRPRPRASPGVRRHRRRARFGTEDDDAGPDDWVLGAVTGVQGHELEEGTALLLHLGTIEFMDGGTIQFRIPEAALADRDWSRVVAEGDSC